MKTNVLYLIIGFLSSLWLVTGCNSVSTFNYSVSQTVIRSALEENTEELKNKSLVIFCTPEKTETINIKHSNKDDYGKAAIDKHSFAAFIVDPGKYFLNSTSSTTLDPDKAYFFIVQNQEILPISKDVFEKQYSRKFLVEQCSFFGSVQCVDAYFPSKVSTAEMWGYYTGKVLASPLYIVWGIHYVGFAGMCCVFVPPICLGGCFLWGATYYLIPEDYRMTLSKIGG